MNEDVIDYDLLEDLVCHIDETCSEGAILVFLPVSSLLSPFTLNYSFIRAFFQKFNLSMHVNYINQGVSEIHMLVDKLAASYQFGGPSSDWILPLHSSVASTDQKKVFLRPPKNIRKVLTSTTYSC